MVRPGHPSRTPLAARLFLLTFVSLAALERPAHAQVNIEAVRKQLDTTDFGARLRLSLTAYAGNTKGVVYGASGLIGGRLGKNLMFASASSDYSKLGGETTVQKSFTHLRHNYELIQQWLWWEEFAQSETDRFRRIQFRGLLGTGPRYRVLKDKEWLELFVGNSYMLEYTEVDPPESATEPAVVHRLNNYLAVALRPDDRVLLGSIFYYQPRFDEITDAHVLSVSSVEFKVTELLRSRMDLTVRYESHPPTGVERTDMEFKSSLEFKF
jgi:putative salt-induced outer membrane protein YdiY